MRWLKFDFPIGKWSQTFAPISLIFLKMLKLYLNNSKTLCSNLSLCTEASRTEASSEREQDSAHLHCSKDGNFPVETVSSVFLFLY